MKDNHTTHKDIDSRVDELFGPGKLFCAETVLTILAERLDIDSPLIPRIATGLCSGMGRTGNVCGAVSGAVLGFGLAAGRDTGEQSHLPCYELVQDFMDRFEAAHGSTTCPGLLGVDIATREGAREAVESGRVWEVCPGLTRDAVRIALAVLEDGGCLE